MSLRLVSDKVTLVVLWLGHWLLPDLVDFDVDFDGLKLVEEVLAERHHCKLEMLEIFFEAARGSQEAVVLNFVLKRSSHVRAHIQAFPSIGCESDSSQVFIKVPGNLLQGIIWADIQESALNLIWILWDIVICFLKGLVSQFVVKGESDYALLIKIDLDGLQVYCSTCFGQFGSVVEFITFLVFFADGNLAGDWLHRNKSSFA